MKAKGITLRQCIISRKRLEKKELIRLVKIGNEVVIDLDHSLQGRGYYIEKNFQTIEIARKKDIISRLTGIKVDDVIYKQLLDVLK